MQSHMCVCVPGLMLVGTLPLSSLGGTGRKHNGCGKKGLALIVSLLFTCSHAVLAILSVPMSAGTIFDIDICNCIRS